MDARLHLWLQDALNTMINGNLVSTVFPYPSQYLAKYSASDSLSMYIVSTLTSDCWHSDFCHCLSEEASASPGNPASQSDPAALFPISSILSARECTHWGKLVDR